MIQSMKWLVLAAAVLWLSGCTHTSEAKVTVVNKGELQTYVSIHYANSSIAPGGRDTFTITWPGRQTIYLIMTSYPVGNSARSEFTSLDLKDGDEITVYVDFKKL